VPCASWRSLTRITAQPSQLCQDCFGIKKQKFPWAVYAPDLGKKNSVRDTILTYMIS
jgi:hypothetical protein